MKISINSTNGLSRGSSSVSDRAVQEYWRKSATSFINQIIYIIYLNDSNISKILSIFFCFFIIKFYFTLFSNRFRMTP
jgi:hypothetical protein